MDFVDNHIKKIPLKYFYEPHKIKSFNYCMDDDLKKLIAKYKINDNNSIPDEI